MKLISKCLCVVAAFGCCGSSLIARNRRHDEMRSFFSESTHNFVSAMQPNGGQPHAEGLAGPQPNQKLHFSFYSFKLRIRPRIGFRIPAMVTLRLVPELELSWTKRAKIADRDSFGD